MSSDQHVREEQPAAEMSRPQAEIDLAITLFPTLALAILREGRAACGRLWFLLRQLDQDGRGWVERAEAYQAFTGRSNALRFCSRRHLSRLLAEGEGLFWTAESDCIWLTSQAKVAEALGLERLSGRLVGVPLRLFLGQIGELKAHFYAAFHSSRAGEREYGPPVSRATIETVTNVPRRTQQLYERRSGVQTRPNIALGPAGPGQPTGAGTAEPSPSAAAQELAWQHGRAYFRFTDRRGQYGRPGKSYHAWRLPNNFRGPMLACLAAGSAV